MTMLSMFFKWPWGSKKGGSVYITTPVLDVTFHCSGMIDSSQMSPTLNPSESSYETEYEPYLD